MREDDGYSELATPAERQSWTQQNNLMYGGLIAIGVVILQGFLTAQSLGASAKISVIAFAIALPLLAVLIMIGALPGAEQRGRDGAAKGVAVLASIVGVIAAFWHIHWVAGVAVLVTGALATGVYGSHFTGSRVGQLTQRFRRGGNADTSATAHQPPPVRHPYPTGPEAPTAFMPHPARQAQPFPGTEQRYPAANPQYPGELTEQISHDQTRRYPNAPGAQQHPGAQQYPGAGGTPES
ncbi:hypothetical protein [Nocardia sp. NPDC051832]|uniref:hypothetical protein n=1 Tax=Nocardia sp. NPDC051832 TaxID=3155673 RepID=UPI0034323175